LIGLGAAPSLKAQEGPAKQLSSIVGVAVEEYGKGHRRAGESSSPRTSTIEAVSFLKDAKDVACTCLRYGSCAGKRQP
jgi:hypothetical protein